MLKPTIYLAPKDLCLLAARWRTAEAVAVTRVENSQTSDAIKTGDADPVSPGPLVAA